MRILTLISLLVISVSLFAADGKRTIGDMTFELEGHVWVQQGLEEGTASSEFATVFGDSKWQRWNRQGSANLRKVLALGPNVVFSAPTRDGESRVFTVHQDKQLLNSSVASSSSVKTTRSILGAAVYTIAQRGGDDASPNLP